MSDSFMLPESAPVRSVLLAWPYPGSDWDDNFEAAELCYWGILSSLSQHVETWVLLHPRIDKGRWQQQLKLHPVAESSLQVIDVRYDDTWIRDYGPLSLNDRYLSFTFNGWGGKFDAAVDNQVAQHLQLRLHKPMMKMDFVAEGGALEINSQRMLLANKDCVVNSNRNNLNQLDTEQLLMETLGVKKFGWLEGIQLHGDDTDGHIDTLARFIDDHTVVYCGPNSRHPDAAILESLESQIQALAKQHHWRAVPLPSPLVKSQLDRRWLPATYANFLMCNEYVFVPVYGLDCDADTLSILKQLFSRQNIVPVHCEALLEQHGSLHCATMQLAAI